MGQPNRPARALLVVAACALTLAACLPSSIRETPSPGAPSAVAATVAPTEAPSPTPGPPTPTPAPTFALHTVVAGDSLTSIARAYGTSGRSIAYWNRDQYPSLDPESPDYDPDGIRRGWVLRILPNQEYVPPPGDGETGEQVTPEPTDDESLYETPSPSPSPSPTPAATPSPTPAG